MKPNFLIGTSGYSYDEWTGVFYPPQLPKSARLDFYASVFNALEVNTTYYGTPKPTSSKRLVRDAHGRLAISVKAPGDLTHRARTDAATIRPFLDYLEPIREAGVLTAVLLQFPNALHHDPASRALLGQAFAALPGLPLAVELRHASWDTPEADAFLRDRGVSRVAVDQPDLRGLSQSRRLALTGPLAYFRYHGRNTNAWYGDERSTGDARYRYRYTGEELQPWIPTVRDAAEKATTTLAFFNNHPEGNAVLDAMNFSTLLGQPRELPRENDLFA